jgi:phosphate-selective porin OprO/OprP
MDNVAWQVAASYVLTGEKASYRSVTPAHSLERSQGHWGAVEIAVRYSELRVDRDAFPIFADPQNLLRGAKAWALGLNWYFNKNAKFVFNYEQTQFTEISAGRKKNDEHAFLQRFQASF